MIRYLTQFFCLAVLMMSLAVAAVAQEDFNEIKLTDIHIQNYIKADPALQKVLEKIDKAGDQPDENLLVELEDVAKTNGFKSFEELDSVAQTLSFIMTGFNNENGDFTEPRTAIEVEIGLIKEDNSIPEKERKELLSELEDAFKTAPEVKFKSNIELVKKYMNQLEQLD